MNERHLGFLSSAALHLLAISFIALSAQHMAAPMLTPVEESILVDVVEIADLAKTTELPKPSIEAAPRETVLDAASEPAITPADAPAKTDGLPDPKAPPLPADSKKTGSRLDTQKLATVLDKSVKDAKRKPREFSDLAKQLEKDLPKQAQLSPLQSATLAQAMQEQVTKCFSMPTGAEGIENMAVTFRIQLTQDGKLVRPPELTEQSGQTNINAAVFRAFTDSTRRAIQRCQPYALPADMFEFWQEQELTFNPRDFAR
jgi:TonB C terminal